MSNTTQKKFDGTKLGRIGSWLLVLLMVVTTGIVHAAAVDKEMATKFAENWLKAAGNALNTEVGAAAVGDIEEFKNADGAVLGYIVSLEPKGFIVVSADDRINPVVIVSKEGNFDSNPQNPLFALLYADLTNRMAAAEKIAPAGQTRGELPEGIQQNKATWARFTTGGTRAAGIGVVSEVWVGSFVESRWSQSGGIYNYYTPTIYDKSYSFDEPGNQNNAPCGCVATGTAQILRYFQWPQKPIGVKEGNCGIETDNGTQFSVSMNLRGGDGTGGAYDWDAMTLVPTGAEKLETYKQIGALCFDAGLSVNMSYSSSASGSNYSPSGMKKFFGYAEAARSLNADDARANLDARRPVGVSISSIIPDLLGGEGHAIVCDGYGRLDGRWYYHMNYGWAGAADAWYNCEEVFATTWAPSFGFALGNLYRQKLQPNDNLGGQIISGRVTDANGNPVAGVKVSIRKKGEEDIWQTMLVWNEPKDPEATPIYQDWDEKGNNNGTQEADEIPGADKFRNTTDANGIWAIDKVEPDDYEIVLEKEGLNFSGTKTITVQNGKNLWANDFVASPLDNLALESWWIDNGVVYLQFNRAVGNVDVNLSKAKIGGTALTAGEAQVIASSNIIAITGVSASGNLSLDAGFLTVDVDGSNTTDQSGMYNVAPVIVLDAVSDVAAGTAAAASKVTKIALKNDALTKDNLLYFQVTGNGLTDADLNSFKIRNITTGKVGTQVPNVSIYSWTPSTGELVVRAYNGEAYIGVDYVPETGTAYLSSDLYTFDDCGPAIIKAVLDKSNKYVTVTWNEPVFGWTRKVQATDLNVILHNNGGTITNAQVESVTLLDADADGYATKMNVFIKYNPSLEVQLNAAAVNASGNLPYTALNDANWTADDDTIAAYRAPAGVETIEVVPRENKVFDALKNASATSNTTGDLLLFDSKNPRLVSAIMSNDNYAIQLTFNKRIFGKSGLASPILQVAAILGGAANTTDFLNTGNFTAVVNYSNGSTETLGLHNNGIYYTLGTNYIYLDFNHYSGPASDNRKKLDPAYNEAANGRTPQSIKLTLKNIVDKDNNALKDATITIPLWPAYTPGKTSLLPPMFTNAKDSYTYIEQPNNQVLVTKAGTNNPDNYLYTPYGKGQSGVDPASDGLIYYGIYYRDLDGDGRIDAVDLNYHNPDYNNGNSPAQLYAGGSAAANFRVWVQNNDPDDIDDSDKSFYPADAEGVNWGNFPKDAPLGNGTADNNIYNFQNNWGSYTNFAKNWICLTPSSVEVVSQNLIKSGNSNNERYSTLRLHIDQTRVRARTYGTRYVMVAYTSPRNVTTYGGNGNANGKYNKYMIAGAKAPTNDVTGSTYARYNDSDETAGVYWRRPYTGSRSDANGTSGYMDNVHIADGFGPVVAWDGAAPVPVSAIAWRATPYVKSGESNMEGYEYLDITFTEPIAYAADKAMSNCGYTADAKNGATSANGYLHGCWGAEVISANTVRFKVNGLKTDKAFSFSGALFGMTPGFFESYTDAGTRNPRSLGFSVNAVGVKPADSRYKVISQGTAVDMFTVDASGASITSYGTSFTQSVNTVELKAVEQGGDWRSTTANWLRNGNSIGAAGTSLRHQPNSTAADTYSLRSNTLSNSVAPGSSVYGIISSLIVRNNTFNGYAVKGGNAEVHCPAADNTFYAPDPLGRYMAFGGASTPVKSVMSGPVYNMVKVGAITQTSGTSRIVAGTTVPVLGIDAAGAAAHRLTAITVRAIDTSMGQFDPSIDLEPLADGATSGLQLYDVNNSKVISVANNGDEWSEWKVNEAGQPYKEVTLRPLTPVTLPTAGGNANSYDFQIRVITSASFNLGDSFVIEIPDNGIAFGSYKTVDNRPATWGTPNGAPGFPFTDYYYKDNNNDGRWAEGDSIASKEDTYTTIPLYDGGKPYFTDSNNRPFLSENGVNIKNLYYAKKNWATNPESSPFYTTGNVTPFDNYSSALGGINFVGTNTDLNYNVSYAPGDDVWYDIGGEPGVYDEGIDIPLFGNADAFPLSWQVAESGAKSAQFRAAATATAGSASTGYISAPSEGPVAAVGLDMRDAGRGFGPRFILDDSILVESISKNIAGGEYTIVLKNGKLIWNNGAETEVPADNGRAVVDDGNGTFIVIRTLDSSLLPTADTTVNFTVSADAELDIQQPSTITGVRVTALGRGNVANTKGTLTRNGTKLSWKGGAEVDVANGGFFFLNGDKEDYLVVQVSQVGGGTSDELSVYAADGRSITPFLNISGLEIMTVSDMVPQGYYTFSYDGAGTLSWGNGSPAKVNVAEGEFVLVEGNGTNLEHAQNFVVVRRTNGPLPAQACTDTLFINQSQLLRVAVTVTGVNGFSITHLADLSNDENSGVSLWWDANADGTFNTGDKFVKLLETPEFTTNGDAYSTVLTPDPQFITSWLSCSQSVSDTSFNFFVCVNTTEDMSYGDSFRVNANFYEPTEPNYTTGGTSFAGAGSGNIVCTSITNTVFKKKTTKGQTIDSNTTVRLASINHFFGTAISGKSVYMTAVTITIIAPEGSTFHPDTAFTPMDAASAANRGIQLVAANGAVIPCAIELITDDPEHGPWTYVLRPETSGGNSAVPQAQDDVEDHFIDVKLASTLPYGVSFYARMETDAVVYNTGKGSAAAAMVTDVLGSTINSEYADLLDSSMVTPTAGLVVNKVGTGVASAYHNIKIGYNVNTNTYNLTWNGNTVMIDATQPGTYILGSGTNSITVTFDPAAFFMEDTLVTSESGRPDEEIAIGTKLTNLAGQGLKYYDANANGQYDLYEPIAYNGELIYGDGDVSLCVVEFTAASGLSFWDKDGDGVYAKGDSIFHDTDNKYTLPWMALLVDSDNYITAGQGGAASGISTSTSFIDAATISPDFAEALPKGLYLYFIDMVADGRGYVYGEDIVIARRVTADGTATTAALQKDAAQVYYDKVVFDPAYGKDGYEEIAAGDLNCFLPMDYVKFRQGGNDPAAFEQGDSIFLSAADTFVAPDFTWTIRVNKDRRIRWYSETAPAPYNQALKSITAIAGLDIACSGATDVVLTSLTVRFVNVSNFTMDDLRSLTTDENSGVQLWRDLDGNGIFNPDIDKLVKLSSAPTLSSDATNYIVKFSPAADNEITNNDVDGIYDFFVVVQPSITANNKQKIDNGDKFQIIINNNDVVLNKTLNKSATLTSGTITIDSRFPALASAPVIADSDSDGYINTITLVFDEALRPGMLDDTSIWQLRDNTNGNPLTVTKATLSSDYKTVTLTLSDADIGSTTGKISIVVIYGDSESALLDWAGNAVDFRIDATRAEDADDYVNYTATSDTVAPQIVHNGMRLADAEYDEATAVKATNFFFHDRNANGVWDDGEDIWVGENTYKCDVKTRVWNGGDNAWTTDYGYVGVELTYAYFCDANGDGIWNGFEFLWIDEAETYEATEEGGEDTVVEGVYVEGNDTVVPLYRTEEIDVFDKDHNGYVDAMRVYFSEDVNDSTMTGYVGTADSYTASKWTVGGRTLTAWRLGFKNEDVTDNNLKNKVVKDIINNNCMYFTFAENTSYDTGATLTLNVASGESLKDLNGNALNKGAAISATTNDRAKPILLAAESDARINAEGVLADDSKLTLTFSEPMAIFYTGDDIAEALKDIQIKKNDAWLTFDASLTKAVEVSADDSSKIVITMAESAGWSYKTVAVKVRDDIDTYAEDTVFGDVAGNNVAINANLAECPVTGIVYKDEPVIEIPIAYDAELDNILRTDDLNVKIFFGSYGFFRSEATFANSFQVAEWKLTVSHNGSAVSEKVFSEEDVITSLDQAEAGFVAFTNREWLFEGGFKVADYVLALDLVAIDPDTNATFNVHTEVAFKAQADICTDYTDIGGGKVVSAESGLVLNNVGKDVASGYYDVTLKLNGGAYTLEWNGNSAVLDDITKVTTVILGDGDNRIQVTLNPAAFSDELNEKIAAGEDFTNSWTILIDQSRKINVFNSKAMNPYNVTAKAMSAVAGLDIANTFTENVNLESVTVHFVSVADFDMSVLCDLTGDETSGVQLWRDANGNSVFDKGDSIVALSSATAEDEGEGSYKVTLTPAAAEPIVGETVDGIYDYYIVVLPKEPETTSNEGPQFKIEIKEGEIVLSNKNNKYTELTSEPYMIDSKAPEFTATIADADADGYIETVELTFDEQLRRDSVDDLTIWQLKDSSNGNALTVVKAELDEACTKVTLTLNGADFATTTSAVSLMVAYNEDNALLDWAGNAVEFRTDDALAEGDYANYITSADTAAPVVLHAGVATVEAKALPEALFFHDRNNNDAWDEGEDIWTGEATFNGDALNRVWNGGDNAWTTAAGYVGKALPEDVEVATGNRAEEIELYDNDGNGKLDAVKVSFSEAIDITTMAGYVEGENFVATAWTIDGREMTVDTANSGADYITFTFAEGENYDSGKALAIAIADETLADAAGNVIVANGLVVSDHAKPVLLAAESTVRLLQNEAADDCYMPEDGQIILTFSENMAQYFVAEDVDSLLGEFEINRNGSSDAWTGLNGLVKSVAAEGNTIVLTMNETTGWGYRDVHVRVKAGIDALPDTVFGDVVGNNIAYTETEFRVQNIMTYYAPSILAPVADEFYRTDNLAVKMFFRSACSDNAFAIDNWTFTVKHNGEQMGEEKVIPVTVENEEDLINGTYVFKAREWMYDHGLSVEDYTLYLNFTWTDPDTAVATDVEYAVSFSAQANVINEYVDITDHAVITPINGMVIRNVGEGVASGYYDFTAAVNAEGQLTLTWNGNTMVIDQENAALYTLGNGDNAITVYVDPAKITLEDYVALTNEPYQLASRILVNKDRVINAFSETAPAPYDGSLYYLNAIAAMDIACGNIDSAKMATITVRVERADEAFTLDDLRELTADENSGLQLWFDAKNMDSVSGVKVGNNRFSPFEDVRLGLLGAPTVDGDEENGWTVTFTLDPEQDLKDFYLDKTFDLFIVVSAKTSGNGHQFKVIVPEDAIVMSGTDTAPYIDSIETQVVTIDGQFPQLVASVIEDTDKDGYLEKITLTFDEALRPMLSDLAIWKLADATTGIAITVEDLEMSDDFKTVTLTLNGAELNTTTGKVSLILDYTASENSVLVDWAGNVVDFRIDDGWATTDDAAAPIVLNSSVNTTTDIAIDGALYFHDRNANGAWDEGEDIWTGSATFDGAMLNRVWNGGDGAWTTVAGYEGTALPEDVEVAKNFRAEEIAVLDTDNDGHIDAIDVYFSEALDPATVESAAWTLAGYGALTATADAENAAHVRFTFETSSAYDTAATPALSIDSTITDLAGNAVIAPQGLALSDNAAPVLVYAKAEGGKIADDTMPEGVTVTLTFSEPVKQYLFTEEESTVDQIMSNFQIHRNNGEWEAITSELVSAVAVEDGKVVLTMVGGTTGWGMGASIDIRLAEVAATDDTVFGDMVGNSLAANTVALYPYDDANTAFIHTLIEFQDAAILNPNDTNNYLRTDALPVQLLLNSACVGNAFQIKNWKFAVEHDGEQTAEAEYAIDAANQAALTSEAGMEVFADASWQIEEGAAPAAYTLKVSFTWIDPDDDNAETNAHDVEYTTTFTALANKGVEPMTVADGDTYGENIAQIQKNASNVWSNWIWGEINITNDNLLIKSYKSYYIDEEGNAVSATVETADAGNGEYVAKMRLNNGYDYLEVGKTYVAVVEAYDEAGDMIGKGVSDGVTVVDAFEDVENMEFTDGTELKVDNTDEDWNVAIRTDSHDTLYAKWTPVSDSLTAKENMRYKYRVVSQFGSSQWSVDAGGMTQPRQDFGSAVLGDKLYAIGGFQDTVLSSVEVYDLNTRKWSAAASLKEARRGFACVKLNDSQIVVAGGTGEGDVALTSMELFNGSAWTTLPVALPEAYDTVKAVKIDDTHVWIIGAAWYKDETRHSVLKTEIRKFDIATMSFDAEVIAAPTITARYGDFQVALQHRADGNSLVIADGIDADYTICRKVDVIDIDTGAVNTVELSEARWGCAMIAVPNAEDAAVDNVWFIGGMNDYFDYLTTVDQLDATGVVATLPGELNIGRAGASVYWNEDLNNVIIVGGFTSDHAWKNIPEIAANDGESWIQCPGTAMNVSRIGQHLEVVGSELNSKRMVLFGGTDLENNYIADTESCIWIETLETSEWMLTEDGVTQVKVEGLSLNEGASYVFEVKAVDEQGYESAASRSAGIYISSSSLDMELTPAIVENAASGQVYALKVTASKDDGTVKYFHYKVMKGEEVVEKSEESVEITETVTLQALTCADDETEATYTIQVWNAIDPLIADIAVVTVAKATYTVDSVDPLDVDSYTLGVNLNGLAAYEWQLDDGEVSEVSTEAEFTVTGLTVGSHTVSLWGIDENESRQSEPTVITLFYKTPDIVGDVLTGVITADKEAVGESDVVTYTLTMSEAIVNDPVAANFTVENGVIESIEDADGNKTTYIITVKPEGDGFVSVTLKANTLFTADKGIPNTASETVKALYYTKPTLTFTPEVDTDEEDFVAYVGDQVAVNINFESDYVLLGGDLGIMFDSTVFEIADVTDGEPDATKMLAGDYGKDGSIASWIKEGDQIVGIRLGGANGKATATAATYATITFNVLKEVTEGSAITLVSLDNTDEYAGIALPGLHLKGDLLAAVDYGEVVIATALKRPTLALTAAETTVEEGEYDLTISLSYALESDVAVDFIENGEVISTETIKAGETALTITMDKEDNFLTGDRVFTYAIACTDDAIILDETAVDVTVIDNDAAITLTAAADAIDEGDQMVITFALADGIAAAADVTFNSPLIPMTDPDTFTSGIDFRMDAEPVIAAGENSGSIVIKTYSDNEIKGDYDITVTLTEMNVGANACSAFAETSVSFTVKDANFKRGDFDGNGIVNYDDVIAFLAIMGATADDADWAEHKIYDLDGDGDVDYDDLIELLSLMEFDGARRGASTRGDKVIRLWLESDKTTVKPGDIITVKLMAENKTGQGMAAFKCNVNFNAADLAYNGEFDALDVVNPAFIGIRDGDLAENGISELIGTYAKRNAMSEIAIDGEPYELAVMSLVVKATAAANINIDLSNLNASTQSATRAGVSVLDGTLDVVTESLTLTVDGGTAVVPEFSIEFAAHQQTRAANVALKVGMADGATYAYEADDLPAFDPIANVYDVRVIDGRRDEDLHTDIRGLANRETWSVKVTVSEGQTLTLDWSEAELPEYFNFTIVKGKYYNKTEVIKMADTTSMTFTEGETFITIVADKVAAAEDEFTFYLTPGWNLIGIPFAMDAASLAKFDGFVFAYDEEAGAYVHYEPTAMVAGGSYWVYVDQAMEITVNAVAGDATDGVALKAGWNFVAPKKGAELVMPEAPVRVVWFYTADGYRMATEDADIQLGRGYWIYTDEDTVIW